MQDEKKNITLPKEVQQEMLKFFMQTSIPRIKREKEKNLLSKNEK